MWLVTVLPLHVGYVAVGCRLRLRTAVTFTTLRLFPRITVTFWLRTVAFRLFAAHGYRLPVRTALRSLRALRFVTTFLRWLIVPVPGSRLFLPGLRCSSPRVLRFITCRLVCGYRLRFRAVLPRLRVRTVAVARITTHGCVTRVTADCTRLRWIHVRPLRLLRYRTRLRITHLRL